MSRKINPNGESMQVITDPKIKEKIVNLAKEEKMTINQALESLILEAIQRGYINKERREMLMKAKS